MKKSISRARQLRKNMTAAEKKLWRALSHRQLNGYRFRRQVPIGPYIADFVCHQYRIVVELDGSQHGDDKHCEYDQRRTEWLIGQGYIVQRFWNIDVIRELDNVVETIFAICARLNR